MEKFLFEHLPDGMILVKKGGRPRADARNIAVLMTRLWRTKILNESVKQADAWILDHWHFRNGITEESTIRRAIRAAEGGPLSGYEISRVPNSYAPLTSECFFDGPVIFEAFKHPRMNGDNVWFWKERMKNAVPYTLKLPRVKFVVVDEIWPLSVDERALVPERKRYPLPLCLEDRT